MEFRGVTALPYPSPHLSPGPACSGLGAGWGPSARAQRQCMGASVLPALPLSGSRLSDMAFHLLQPGGGQGRAGLGQACLLCQPWDPLWEHRNVHVAGRPHSKAFRPASGGLAGAAQFSHLPGRTEGRSWAGQGEAMEGLGPTSCRLDQGQGEGREALQKAVSPRGAGPGERQAHPPRAAPACTCRPGRGTPWGLCAQHLPQWEGPEGAEPALSHGLQRNGLLEGPWASQMTVSPPTPRPGVGVGPAGLWLQGLRWHQAGTAAGARGSRPPPARGSRRGPPAAHPSAWPAPSG